MILPLRSSPLLLSEICVQPLPSVHVALESNPFISSPHGMKLSGNILIIISQFGTYLFLFLIIVQKL